MSSRRRTARRLVTVAVLSAAVALPASASATTVRLGPDIPFLPESNNVCPAPCTGGRTFAQTVSPQALDEAPASGVITAWRVDGAGALKLRVLRFGGEEESELVGEGTSAPATNARGQANATSLPIRAGYVIGVDEPAGSGSEVGVENVGLDTAVMFEWQPSLADGGGVQEPKSRQLSQQLLLNADVVLAPIISSLAPASGGTAGGTAVTILGKYLDGATAVTFGSTPASSFSVDSPGHITAIAPASAASTVDLRVTGPGGSSDTGAADKYTFIAPAANPTQKPPIQGGPAFILVPAVTGFSESAAKWRRGRSLPRISTASSAPVGTTFSFSLNEPATTTLTFTHSVAGRRAHGRCVAPTAGNAHKPKCKRTVLVGSFGVSGKPGLDKVRFQGRLSSAKTLKPGTYAVSITARDVDGLKAVSRSLAFTIVS
jgi:hypothetical protein